MNKNQREEEKKIKENETCWGQKVSGSVEG